VRSKDIIEGEKIDLEVREMEEAMRNMEKPEIEAPDVEMEESKQVDVSEIDVEMMSEDTNDAVLFVQQEFIEELLVKVFSCLDEKK